MVKDEASPRRIRNYLNRFFQWWVNTSETWEYTELIQRFLACCWDATTAAYAAGLLLKHIRKSRSPGNDDELFAVG
jgi:hypothetical protein